MKGIELKSKNEIIHFTFFVKIKYNTSVKILA